MDNRPVSSLDRVLSSLILAIGFLASPPSPAATPLQPFALFNTGVDSASKILTGANVDPHYTIVSSPDPAYPGPDAIVTSAIAEGYWTPNGPDSKWIAPTANQEFPDPDICNASGKYTYRTTFDLKGFDPATAVIEGSWMSDNWGIDILVNGVSTGFLSGSYNAFTPFNLKTGFVAGTNTIDFVVSDTGCPTGIRVEISKAEAAPGLDTASITAIAAGGLHTCALTSGGSVKCWGYNSQGQIGDNSNTNRTSPVDVPGLSSGVAAVATGNLYTCALTASGGVKCWGDNSFGQLGDGSYGNLRLTPVDVSGLASGVLEIAGGDSHTCVLMTSGGVKCWGSNLDGELGDGSSSVFRLTPADVSGLASGVVAITAGHGHNCALTTGGGVKCWGRNVSGELGDNSTTDRLTPIDVPGLASGVTAIAAGALHTCALTTGGAVMCWGNNETGQLGDNSTTERHTPVPVSGLAGGVAAIAAGGFHTCALTTSGGVKCWGENVYGELGDNSTTRRYTPVDVSGLASGVTSISAGFSHTCARMMNGDVKCWGRNVVGQLGDNTLIDRLAPVTVSGLAGIDTTPDPFSFPSRSGVVIFTPQVSDPVTPTGYNAPAAVSVTNGTYSIGCGLTYTSAPGTINPGQSVCAQHQAGVAGESVTTTLTIGGVSGTFTTITAGGAVLALSPASLTFGNQLVGTTSPGQVVTLTNSGASGAAFISGTTGDFSIASQTCNNSIPASASCTFTVVFTPTAKGARTSTLGVYNGVAGTLSVALAGTGATPDTGDSAAIAAGGTHTCALTPSGGLKCWGLNNYGELGDSTFTDRHTPADVSSLTSGVAAITAGTAHTCALTTAGGVQCWGGNGGGQLGDTSGASRNSPVAIPGLASGVAAISAGGYHTCALTTNGGVKCLGYNLDGTLGDGTTVGRMTPVDVSGLTSGVAAISAGFTHTCALTIAGGVKCWGSNTSGQLGDNSATARLTPVDVQGLASGVAAISAGYDHTCALTTGGAVKCWGNNGVGQLGDNSTTNRVIAVAVTGLGSGVAAISAGGSHTCAITTDGGVKCWGNNSNGQLGDNSTTDRLIPVAVANLASGVVTIAAGGAHSCALMSSGSVKCWGYNEWGQIGDNTVVDRLTPIDVVGLNGDTTPDPFTFPSRSGVVLYALQVSDPVTPGGYTSPAPISVANGQYALDCNFQNTTAAPGTIQPGQSVCVLHNAAGISGQSVTTTLTIGGVSGTFTTTALAGAGLSLSPTSLSFGNQQVGTASAGQVVTVSNSAATSAGLNWSISGDFSISSTTCAATIAGNASCTFTVTFTPMATGSRAGTLQVFNGAGTQSASLAGTATPGPAVLSLSPTSPNFGFQAVGTASAGRVFTLSNSGGSGAGLSAPSVQTGDYAILGTTCGASLAAGASCTITVAFAPTVARLLNDTLAIFDGGNVAAIGLVGTGVPQVPGNITSISAGGLHTCALTAAGGVKCWGLNSNGQLGDGTTTDRPTPVDVLGLASGVAAIASGYAHTCALTIGGGVKCWGRNFEGELGDNTTTGRISPVDVSGLASGVSAITAAWTHTCALTVQGGVQCWGDNEGGQLGDGSTEQRLTPVAVSGLVSGVAIATGNYHACALINGGGVQCWGTNSSGQLGDNSTTQRLTPVYVSGFVGGGAAAITAGSAHTCALTTGGGVKCWGYNQYGQLGDNAPGENSVFPVNVNGLASGVAAVAAGGNHSCVLTTGGAARCWGFNAYGQLGDNSTTNRYTPVAVATLSSGVFEIAAGTGHTCAIATDGVKCWGYNFSGQLGDGTVVDRLAPVTVSGTTPDTTPDPFTFPSLNGVVIFAPQISDPVTPTGYNAPSPISVANGTYSIGCGSSNTYVSTPGTINPGQSVCVQHYAGEAGVSVTTTLTIGGVSGTFTTTTAGGAVLSISPASLTFGNRLVGTTSPGQVVTLTNSGASGAAFLSGITGDFSIASQTCNNSLPAGASCTFTVVFTPTGLGPRTGTLGTYNGAGTLSVDLAGNGTGADPSDIVAVATGQSHTCALTVGGGVKCWGSNFNGEVGDNSGTDRPFPVDVPGLGSGVVAISAGRDHTCVLTTSGGVKCWGYNGDGQLGDGSTTNRSVPTDVSGLASGVAAIAAGGGHTCVVMTNQSWKCWGDNSYGQLGDGTTNARLVPAPGQFFPFSVAAIAVGDQHTCVRTTSSGVKCWGRNSYGGLGDNSTTNRLTGVDVPGLTSGVAAIAAGGYHTCALMFGGGMKCWGENVTGDLGDNSTTSRQTPVDVSGLASGVSSIATGFYHTCALTTGGGMKCWGWNLSGQVGDGSTTNRPVPTDVSGLASGVAAIAAGDSHTCAVTSGGGVKCWGYALNGRLGTGPGNETRPFPEFVSGLTGFDSLPDAFSFPAQTGVAIGTVRASTAIMPTGYYDPATITVAGGEYSVGCTGTFTTTAGTILPGQNVCVRHVASAAYSTSVTTTLTIGGVSGTFTSTTASAPSLSLSTASLAFGSQPVGTTSAAQSITITNTGGSDANGLGWGVAGDFSIASTTCPSTLIVNLSCTIMVTFTPISLGGRADELLVFSANSVPSSVRAILSGTGTFSDVTPNAFSFVDQFLVATNTVVTSAPVQITGLTSPAPVTVIGGTFAVSSTNSCAGDVVPFGSAPAMVANNQYVCVRHTTSAVPGGSNDTQLIVGGLGDTFTTVTKDTVPAAFALGSQTNVGLSTVRTSAAVAISGINAPAPFSVSGGEISVNCTGTFAASGSLAPGSSICARHVSAAAFNATTTTTVTVGGVASTFTTTTFDANGDADNDGIPNGVEYNEARNPEAKDNAVFTSARLFAMQQYRDFLGREGDAGGIAAWTNYVDGGGSRASATEGFFGSAEFQGSGSPVARLYFAYFLRIPDYGGLTFWTNYFRTGHSLNEISNAFAGSQEFVDRYGALTNPAFVDLVYQNVLARAPDAGGKAFWLGQLNGGMSRGEMMVGFSESAEYQATIFSDTYVTMMYMGMLKRAPDGGGFTFWTNYIDQGNSGQALINGFLLSPEYHDRFLP